jgi:tRNA pseudouridine55 synthase
MLGIKKAGHTGTLDPDVTGVLPVCLGRATKIAEYMAGAPKEYEGEVTLGYSTTTEDSSGEIADQKKVKEPFSEQEIEEVLQSFKGEITQVPPMYSAVKVNGKRLYEYARAGIDVKRPARTVNIYDIRLLKHTLSFHDGLLSFRFFVSCSKGTYIRTLAVMIGKKLGYPAHMSNLIRTASAFFRAEDCITLEQLGELAEGQKVTEAIFPLEKGISHLPQKEISDTLAVKVRNGMVLPKPEDWPGDPVVFLHHAKAVAIYQNHPDQPGLIKPAKVLETNENR